METADTRAGRRALLICLLLAALVAAVYFRTYWHDYIYLDDSDYVFNNPRVLGGLTWSSFIWAFTSGHAANWHPLTWLSHMLDIQLFGSNPGPQHLVNVLFHILNALLLFYVLWYITGSSWRSAFCAALFALHPLHVESVAWISERKDVLSTLFLMLALIAYARYARHAAAKWYVAALCLFALGLMCKPMLVTLPFLMLLLDYWPLGRYSAEASLQKGGAYPQRSGLRQFLARLPRLVGEKIPFFVLTSISSVVTFYVQRAGGSVVQVRDIPLPLRLENAVHSYAEYLLKTLWPAGLSPFYPYPAESQANWKLAAAGLVLACISFLVVRFGSRFAYLPVAWFWYVGALVPVIGLVQVGAQSMADRYSYIPLIGIFVGVAWGMHELLVRWKASMRMAGTAAVILILALSVKTWFQVSRWKDSSRLFEYVLKISPQNYMAFYVLGTLSAAKGEHQAALDYYRKGLRIAPGMAAMLNNMGSSLYTLGRVDEAVLHYEKAVGIDPAYAQAHYNLGVALYACGLVAEAAGRYKEAIRLKPDHVEAHYNLGIALAGQGNLEEAVSVYAETIRLKPDYAEAYNNLGIALYSLGRVREAYDAFVAAVRLKPDFADARRNVEAVGAGLRAPP